MIISKIAGYLGFISHMVQMKVEKEWFKTLTTDPFISHMVQMKGSSNSSACIISSKLYIPHGSDERGLIPLIKS